MLIYTDYQLEQSNTFNVKAKAQFYFEITSVDDVIRIIQKKKYGELPRLILGNGSNILFTQNFKGVVVKNILKGIEIISEDDNYATIKAASGENFDDIVDFCVKKRYSGIENLSGIPGSIGGAIVQNIGAYGQEIANSVAEVQYLDLETYQLHTLNAAACKFGYRDSIFKKELKDKAMITSATFQLSKKFQPCTTYGNLGAYLANSPIITPLVMRRAVLNCRQDRIPDFQKYGNAGSFFQNPELNANEADKIKAEHPELKMYPQPNGKIKLSAGQLIDLCGFKQTPDPTVGVSNSNALIVINLGDAKGKDILAFAKKIQKKVKETFGIKIIPEVDII